MAFDEFVVGTGIPIKIENLQMGAAHSTEKEFTVPDDTTSIILQARDGDIRIYALTSGTLYFVLSPGKPMMLNGRGYRSKTFYCSRNHGDMWKYLVWVQH
jgi:hypothetical protein